jgi:hypothetical protein
VRRDAALSATDVAGGEGSPVRLTMVERVVPNALESRFDKLKAPSLSRGVLGRLALCSQRPCSRTVGAKSKNQDLTRPDWRSAAVVRGSAFVRHGLIFFISTTGKLLPDG